MIDLLLLGNGAMMPLPGRWLSCFLMRCRGEITLFDCGEGTQVPWRLFGWGFRSVGAICLTHLHADHVGGLPGVIHSIANAGREEPITIFGPVGTQRVVTGLSVIAADMPFEVRVRELESGDRFTLPGGPEAVCLAGDHRIPVLIYRVGLARAPRFQPDAARALGVPIERWHELQAGRPVDVGGAVVRPEQVLGGQRPGVSFGFVTDTRPLPAFAKFLNGVDLLICEGTYGPSQDLEKAKAHMHMTFAEAAQLACDASAGQLWLTHFSPALEEPANFVYEALAHFRQTTVGVTGLTTTLLYPEAD
jgi:ribonuclease Z